MLAIGYIATRFAWVSHPGALRATLRATLQDNLL